LLSTNAAPNCRSRRSIGENVCDGHLVDEHFTYKYRYEIKPDRIEVMWIVRVHTMM